MMFMISGRATNENGSPIVRDGVVAAIHAAGHQVVTAQPRRGSYSYVDYLVAHADSIRRRVTKVRWAVDRGVSVIDYAQLWGLINHGTVPTVERLPAETAEPRTTMAGVRRQEAVERHTRQAQQDAVELERLRAQARLDSNEAMERAREEGRVSDMAERQAAQAAAERRNLDEEGAERLRAMAAKGALKKPEPVVGKPRRRKIVTRR